MSLMETSGQYKIELLANSRGAKEVSAHSNGTKINLAVIARALTDFNKDNTKTNNLLSHHKTKSYKARVRN